jgi:hypothetical protein
MYRIWANDWLSDLGNLTRIKDAAEVIALRRAGHDRRLLKWKSCPCEPTAAPPISANGNFDPQLGDGGGS